MLALDRLDRQTPGQLASLLGVRPPTITKTINRLQAQGFLDKKASETDARQAYVSLTDQGREAIRAIERSVRKTETKGIRQPAFPLGRTRQHNWLGERWCVITRQGGENSE